MSKNPLKLRRVPYSGSTDSQIVDLDGKDIGRISGGHDKTACIAYPDKVAKQIVRAVNGRQRLVDQLDAASETIARLRGKPYKPEETDLRAITRRSDTCVTTVGLRLSWEERNFRWLVLGEAHLSSREGGNKGWTLKAYLTSGVTDFEHDSAYALQLPLIGVQLDSVYYHSSHIVGWVSPEDASDFRVPRPGYNPMEHEDAVKCDGDRCGGPHVIVPENHYCPPFDRELFEAVKGKRVEIHIGPVVPKEDDDE